MNVSESIPDESNAAGPRSTSESWLSLCLSKSCGVQQCRFQRTPPDGEFAESRARP